MLAALLSSCVILAPWPAAAHVARAAAPAAPVVRAIPAGLSGPGLSGLSLAARPLSATSLGALPSLGPVPGLAPAPLLTPAAALPAAQDAASPAPRAALEPAASAPASASEPVSGDFAGEESVRGKTVILVGTKGSRPFIIEEAVRVAKALGLNLVLVDDPQHRANSAASIPDSHFIAAPINTRSAKTMAAIAETVAAHPEAAKAHAVTGFMSLYASVTGRITDRLGAKGIAGDVVAAADNKPETRKRLNADPTQAVPFAEISSETDARRAYHAVSQGGRYKVMLKTSRGENSRFLDVNLASEDEAAAAYLKMDAAVRDFVARPEAKETTFATHPGLMMERMLEKSPGTVETSVEVVMQDGKAAFAVVSDTRGIGKNGELAGGILVFPSQQPAREHAALIAASERALAALGLRDGNARLDMFTTPEGPRVIEINPFMGGVAIWSAVKSLTGMSLVEQGLRAVLGLKVDPGHAPDGVLHYIFLASSRNGTVEAVEGLESARKLPGVELARSFVGPGEHIAAAKGSAYEEWAEVIGKGRTWREAIEAALSAARRMTLRITGANGETVRARGDYQQPSADDLAGRPADSGPKGARDGGQHSATPGPGLFSKLVMGFLSTFLLVSTVVESTSLAVSQLTNPLAQGFLALTLLTSVSYAFYTAGALAGGSVIKRFGIRASYRAVLAARAALWTAIALLFDPVSGTISLWALVPLFSLDYFFHSIGRVAEHSLQVAWFKGSEASSSRFGSYRDFIEYGTVFVGSGMALLIAKFGFGVVLYPAPVAFAAAALIALALKLPEAGADARTKAPWNAGLKTVLSDHRIYKPLLGFALVNSFLYMMYYIVAAAFGAFATPTPEQAAGVAGSLTAVYGLGALIGSLYMDRVAARITRQAQALPPAERRSGETRLYSQSAARVLPWAAAALLGSWLMVSDLQLGTLLWPIFPVSLALLAIGFTAQLASNHLDTLMKAAIPSGEKDMAVGAIRALIYASHVLGFILWGGLFALFGTAAFAIFAGFYTVAAGVYLWLARALARGLSSAPAPASPASSGAAPETAERKEGKGR